jgi:hypothetical protein
MDCFTKRMIMARFVAALEEEDQAAAKPAKKK